MGFQSKAGSSAIAIAAPIRIIGDNVGLRLAMQQQTPLIYLHGIVQGLYEAAGRSSIVEDHPAHLELCRGDR